MVYILILAKGDFDFCKAGRHNCHPNATCYSGYKAICTCKPGFEGNGKFCRGKDLYFNKNTRIIMRGYWPFSISFQRIKDKVIAAYAEMLFR